MEEALIGHVRRIPSVMLIPLLCLKLKVLRCIVIILAFFMVLRIWLWLTPAGSLYAIDWQGDYEVENNPCGDTFQVVLKGSTQPNSLTNISYSNAFSGGTGSFQDGVTIALVNYGSYNTKRLKVYLLPTIGSSPCTRPLPMSVKVKNLKVTVRRVQ